MTVKEMIDEVLAVYKDIPEEKKLRLPYSEEDFLQASKEVREWEEDILPVGFDKSNLFLQQDLEEALVKIAYGTMSEQLERKISADEVAVAQFLMCSALILGIKIGSEKGFHFNTE